jgi:hypothetical protein
MRQTLNTLAFWFNATAASVAQHQTTVLDEPNVGGTLPYQIEIREVSFAPAEIPNIHSVAAAIWDEQWIILAGRTNGLHGMTGRNAFDPAFENREIRVIDPKARLSWHKSLETSDASGLNQDEIDSLSSVNTEFYQDDDTLLVVGGYGYKRSVSDHVTYDRLTAIDLPGIVSWVKAPGGTETSLANDHIHQIVDSYFQVTGGGLEKIGNEYQLVFGQNYPGRYRPNFNGIYTQSVRRFRVTGMGASFAVPSTSKQQTAQNPAYRRRDLNIAKTLRYGETPGEIQEAVVALSGVFTPSNGAWTIPVVIREGGELEMQDPLAEGTLKQAFQIYHCAKTGLFHRATGEMHHLLFGGITVLEHQEQSNSWTRDDNAPFTNQCGVVVRHPDGHFEQYLLPSKFPRILSDGKELRFGANAEFFPNPAVPRLDHSVFDLAAITEPTVIGHIFGGLVADAGNRGNTGSSGRIFEVTLTPILPPEAGLKITTFPSPATLLLTPEPGVGYLLESSSDLTHWNRLSLPKTGDTAPLNWSINESPNHQFFRVIHGTTSKP